MAAGKAQEQHRQFRIPGRLPKCEEALKAGSGGSSTPAEAGGAADVAESAMAGLDSHSSAAAGINYSLHASTATATITAMTKLTWSSFQKCVLKPFAHDPVATSYSYRYIGRSYAAHVIKAGLDPAPLSGFLQLGIHDHRWALLGIFWTCRARFGNSISLKSPYLVGHMQ